MALSDGDFETTWRPPCRLYRGVLTANAEPGCTAPVFDVHLLGMGGETRINSLFPYSPRYETERLVVGVEDSPAAPQRIT